MILSAEFDLIWTTPWPDEKELFLKFSEIRNSRNSQNSVWKPKFFPRQAIPKNLFALHSDYTGDTPYRLWFELDNSLTRWKRPVFKIPFSRNSKNSMGKSNFFPRQAKQTILFALNCQYAGDTQYRVWFGLGNSLTRWKRPVFKIPFSRNSKSSMWKCNFFPRQAIPKHLFALHSHYIGDTPFRVWFDLDNSLTRWKRRIFKITFSRNSKSSVWKPNLFPRQAKPIKLYALHCHLTGDTQCRVWFDLDNSLTRWKRSIFEILKNSQFAKFAKFRMETIFFS